MKLNIGKSFGQALKNARRAASFTQNDLSEISGLDRTYISLLERGCRKPSLETVMALTVAMDIETLAFVATFLKHFDAPNSVGIQINEPLIKTG